MIQLVWHVLFTFVKLLPVPRAPPLDLVVLAPVRVAHVDLVVLIQSRLVLPVEEGESIFLEFIPMFLFFIITSETQAPASRWVS